MNEYYELLGLTESATDEEIKARYEEMKAKAKEDRWLDGEAGNEAARLLTKLNTAYKEIMAERKERSKATSGENSLEEVAALLKKDEIAKAQSLLDDFNERNAEWHYLQAVVFYKQNWMNDSKKQLEIAIQMDPDNAKYRNAYGKMNAKNEYEKQSARTDSQNPYDNRRYDAPMDGGEQMGGNACTDCISCCYLNLCLNCCLSCCCQ